MLVFTDQISHPVGIRGLIESMFLDFDERGILHVGIAFAGIVHGLLIVIKWPIPAWVAVIDYVAHIEFLNMFGIVLDDLVLHLIDRLILGNIA